MTKLVKARSVDSMCLRSKADKIGFLPCKCKHCKYKKKDNSFYNCRLCIEKWKKDVKESL